MRVDLSLYELGMGRDGLVTLNEHQKKWATAFSLISKDLKTFLNPLEIDLQHIGSTSIPGIKAKPILDILGVIDDLEYLDAFQERFEEYGFTWKGEYGITGRRYCVQYDAAEKNGYLHLHIFEKGHPEVSRHLLFRDYLRAVPEMARKYEEEKDRLMQLHLKDRKLYSSEKTSFIEQVLDEAQNWSIKRNQIPASSI